METTAKLPTGLTVNEAIAMWQASNPAAAVSSEAYRPDYALFGAGEFHGMTNARYRRPRAPKAKV